MSNNNKIRTELLHSDICNRIVALCSGNTDLAPSHELLDTVFALVVQCYDENVGVIDPIVNILIGKDLGTDEETIITAVADDQKLFRCYAIMYSLAKNSVDIQKKLEICRFITNIIKTNQLTMYLTAHATRPKSRKSSYGWGIWILMGGAISAVAWAAIKFAPKLLKKDS